LCAVLAIDWRHRARSRLGQRHRPDERGWRVRLAGGRGGDRRGVIAALIVTVAYAIIGTALVPRLWTDPMGPMLKVLPILALHLAALGIVDDR
jgi:hypothetical protein